MLECECEWVLMGGERWGNGVECGGGDEAYGEVLIDAARRSSKNDFFPNIFHFVSFFFCAFRIIER